MNVRSLNAIRSILCAFGMIVLTLSAVHAQKYTGSPVTKVRLIRAIESKQFAVPILVKQIQISGVDFKLTPSVENELVSARANQQIIDAVENNYRYEAVTSGGSGRTKGKPPVPGPDITAQNYERLFYEGVATLNQLRMVTTPEQAANVSQSVINTGNQAIRVDPSRPEAYTLVGSAYIFLRNFDQAKRYCQWAVDRGGNLAFPVYHLSGIPHVEILYIGQGFLTVESNQEYFQFNSNEISNPSSEDDFYFPNGNRAAVFSITTRKNGRTDKWYFTPANTFMPQEAGMIMQLISKNTM